MSSNIQACKIQSHFSCLDFNSNYTSFAIGGKESIKIYSLNMLDPNCWFDCKKTIGKYKGTSIIKTCVSQLSWNKQGVDLIAIGTTSGYALVYDAMNPSKSIMQEKGHDGNINNIQWNLYSKSNFLSSSFENYILQWDTRTSQNPPTRYQYSQNTKIRDIKFNPFKQTQIAVQSTTKLQISDLRKISYQSIATYQIHDSESQGIGVQWDPRNQNIIASAISKEINIFDINGQRFQYVDAITHYSLIKSFYWMKTKENYFGVLGQQSQKNIFFYDLQDKNKISYMYGGHTRSIDCWKMNSDETILLSLSNVRQRSRNMSQANSYGFVVAQKTQNFYDPNQNKFNFPITFDNDNNIAFCLNDSESSKKSISNKKKDNQTKQINPMIYSLIDNLQWYECQLKCKNLKEEIVYLSQNYMVQGKNEQIAQNNYKIAKRIGKDLCAQVWKNIFSICFPPLPQYHTIQSIFQEKLELDVQIVQSKLVLYNKQQNIKEYKPINICQILQNLVDQNELQSAVFASICIMNKNMELIPFQFINKIFMPYIDILRNFQFYDIAADTILMMKYSQLTSATEDKTLYNISCGWCKQSIVKGKCQCNKLCVICEKSLGQRMVIWCKYCGHGGHASQYKKWFLDDKKVECPQGCGHTCFTADDFL